MFRWLITCLLLCVLTVGLISWLAGAWTAAAPTTDSSPGAGAGQHSAATQPGVVLIKDDAPLNTLTRSIVIPDGRLLVVEKQEVPAEAEGKLLFIGTEVKSGEMVSPDREIKQMTFYPAVQADPKTVPANLLFPLELPNGGTKSYRRWMPDLPLRPQETAVAKELVRYRQLAVGETVQKGDLVALVNPEIAVDELYIAITGYDTSHFELTGAQKVRDEYMARYQRNLELVRINPNAVPAEEVCASQLAWEKYIEEAKGKMEAKRKAEREVNASITKLRQHQIRAAISGKIKIIYKNSGDAVHKLDPVVQIMNMNRLRVEAVVGVEQLPFLKEGMKAIVEASRPDSPWAVLTGHHQEVTCVAVSNTPSPIVISGSEDRTVRGWDVNNNGGMLWELGPFSTTVRAIACSPRQASHQLALIGIGDGSLWTYDLSQPKQAPVELGERHRGPVNAVAFSPDGSRCATAGEDRTIVLWDVGTRKQLYAIANAHRAAITSLTFASADQLVSASRDNTLVTWRVEEGKPPVRGVEFDHRHGEVTVLNTHEQRVLVDQAKELIVESLKDKRIEGVLQLSGGASTFTRMALFAPDGKTILTTGTENRLQLWRTPPRDGRGAELRQFLWTSPVTCGAFVPSTVKEEIDKHISSFIVTGTQDGKVLLWTMPSKEEIDKHIPGKVVLAEPALDSSSLQVRLWVELEEVPSWLMPGSSATIVVPLENRAAAKVAGR
jgi:hypothetical protein